MDLIDKRDEVVRTFLEYGITECDWCGLRKADLADCAEAIVEKLTIPVVSQQRELLIAYNLDFYKGIHDVTLEHIEQKVDKYLSNL